MRLDNNFIEQFDLIAVADYVYEGSEVILTKNGYTKVLKQLLEKEGKTYDLKIEVLDRNISDYDIIVKATLTIIDKNSKEDTEFKQVIEDIGSAPRREAYAAEIATSRAIKRAIQNYLTIVPKYKEFLDENARLQNRLYELFKSYENHDHLIEEVKNLIKDGMDENKAIMKVLYNLKQGGEN